MTQVIYFSAAFGHPLSGGQIGIMPAIFNAHWRSFKEIWPTAEFVDENRFSGWSWQETGPESAMATLHERGYLELTGPCGFEVRVGRRFALVQHVTTWSDFISDELTRIVMRETCRYFAGIFQSSTWLYLPSHEYPPSLVGEWIARDLSLAQVMDQLQSLCGPPSERYPESEQEGMTPNLYFLDGVPAHL